MFPQKRIQQMNGYKWMSAMFPALTWDPNAPWRVHSCGSRVWARRWPQQSGSVPSHSPDAWRWPYTQSIPVSSPRHSGCCCHRGRGSPSRSRWWRYGLPATGSPGREPTGLQPGRKWQLGFRPLLHQVWLTHWDRDKMAAILLITFWKAFSCS